MNSKEQKKTILEKILFPARKVNVKKLEKSVSSKTILITGATYGIGESLAHKLAFKGVTLILVARTAEKLEQMKVSLEQKGASVFTYPANLQDMIQVESMLEYVYSLASDVDIFVNNAGKSIYRSIENSLDRFQDFTRTMSLNYYAPVRISLSLIPALIKNKGHLINISSLSTLLAPAPNWAAYQASKSAFDKWVLSAAPELKSKGMAVTSIYFPLVRTRMIEPSKFYDNTPAMLPDQAADIICRAIVYRTRSYSPWWAIFGELASVLFIRIWEMLTTYYLKRNHV